MNSLKEAFCFLRKLRIKPLFFILPAFFALAGSLFEGVTLSLLIPLVKGIIQMDIGSLREVPLLGNLFHALPGIFASNRAVFGFLVFVVFSSSIMRHVLQYQSMVLSAWVIRQFADRLRRHIFERYLEFNKLFFDRHSLGQLHEILMGFTSKIEMGLIQLESLLNYCFLLIVYVGILFVISWELTLVTLIVFPVLHYSLNWLFTKIRRTSQDYAVSVSTLGKRISDILSAIPLIKAYNMEEKEKAKFAQLSGRVRMFQFSIDKKNYLVSPLQEVFLLAMVLLLVSIMAFLVIKGGRSDAIASYLIYFYALRRATTTFGVLNHIRSLVAGLEGPMDQIRKILTPHPEYLVPNGRLEFKGLRKGIEFRNLSFSYPGGPVVLRDISFEIKAGSRTALVGPTGSGKSTLVSLLLRFYDCPPGTIFIDGTDIRAFDLRSIRNKTSIVSQDPFLFHDTLRKNLIYGLERQPEDDALFEILRKARLYDYVMNLPHRLETVIGDKGIQLSGGEKQRLSIARALLKGAEILILDEPTSALDSKTERLIQEAVGDMVKGKTCLMIAHRFSILKDADAVIVLEGGLVAEAGAFEELIRKKGKFFENWILQHSA